jgi:Cu+-exporting ATPase
VGLLILSSVFLGDKPAQQVGSLDEVVSIQNGIQIINVTAKGGFSPQYIQAQKGIPTELHVATNGTYDCSSTLVIPRLGYSEALEPTGVETIKLSAAEAQGNLDATCGMGMYDFEINFM